MRTRPLWLLNRKSIFSADRIIVRDDKFKIETSGYWKKLASDEVGIDKSGEKITGKTWVKRTESYYEAKTDNLIITNIDEATKFKGENAGLIYIMRNPTFEKNVYKIGLTRNSADDRAKQLSKTSVPDYFYVMREWAVKDCVKAEKKIHVLLHQFRVDPRREFFDVDMQLANETIQKVVNQINSELQ